MRPPLSIPLAILLLVFSFAVLAPAPTIAQTVAQRAPIVDVAPSDVAMRTAIARARKTLPEFWDAMALRLPGTEDFSLKVALAASGNETEHIWVNFIERIGDDRYVGVLANEPRAITGRKIGDRVEFDEAQISDWTFMRNGKIVGNETLRPLLSRMPRSQADQLRAMLEKP